ncbi:WD40 repeat-like protein [Suillus hirtellus]|nr:WD40 repeat-like protein [Suillus hirtellus]
MASSTAETKETSAITPHQNFKGHTERVRGVIHLPGGQRIITCSEDGSLRVWNLKSGKQIGEDWRDGGGHVYCIALSPDGKKVVSGRHTERVFSVCWSRDSRGVLSGSHDGTARQWDVESGKTILGPIKTGHSHVWTAIYSPDMSMIATGGRHGSSIREAIEIPIKIWNTKTGKLVATLKGHKWIVGHLAWTKNRETLISVSHDHSIRTWNTETWKQTAVLKAHTDFVWGIAISPNDRILASASIDKTVLLWNLDNGQPIGPPLQHADLVVSVSFSEDGKLLATGCADRNAYTWDVVAIVTKAGLDDLLLNSKAILDTSATQPPVQRSPPGHRPPQDFFDGVLPNRSYSSARRRSHSSASPGSTLLGRLFHHDHSPSSRRYTPLSSPLDWARNILKQRKQTSPAVVEVPCAPGLRRNACAREKRKKTISSEDPYCKYLTASKTQCDPVIFTTAYRNLWFIRHTSRWRCYWHSHDLNDLAPRCNDKTGWTLDSFLALSLLSLS